MSGRGSRNKGNGAEREVAKILQAWWGQLEPECKFVRTPGSGGWAGPAVRHEFRASGDLMTTAKKFPYVIEVKRRENWTWKTVVAGKRSPVWGWWLQTQRQAAEQKLLPMLWFRHSNEEWHVMIGLDDAMRVGIEIEQIWDEDELLIEFGESFPCVVKCSSMLQISPKRFVI